MREQIWVVIRDTNLLRRRQASNGSPGFKQGKAHARMLSYGGIQDALRTGGNKSHRPPTGNRVIRCEAGSGPGTYRAKGGGVGGIKDLKFFKVYVYQPFEPIQ